VRLGAADRVGRLTGLGVDADAGAGRPLLGLVEVGDAAGDLHLATAEALLDEAAAQVALSALPLCLRRVDETRHESALRVETAVEVVGHEDGALFGANHAKPVRPGPRGGGGEFAAGDESAVDGAGHFESMRLAALDLAGRTGLAVFPLQAIAGRGLRERIFGDPVADTDLRAADLAGVVDQPGGEGGGGKCHRAGDARDEDDAQRMGDQRRSPARPAGVGRARGIRIGRRPGITRVGAIAVGLIVGLIVGLLVGQRGVVVGSHPLHNAR